MFSFLGRAVARYWPIVLITWCLLLVLGWLSAPAWDSVTRNGEFALLLSSTPSQRADQLFRNAFPAEYAGSSIVLVLWREGEKLTAQDRYFITDELAQDLGKLALLTDGHPPLITRIRTLADPGCGALLVGPDHRATLILMELSTAFIDPKNPPLVANVEEIISNLRGEGHVPEGLQIAVTGSATTGRDLEQAAQQGARTVEVWAAAVVVVLLLLLYRAPLLALIPLLTVFFAVRISLSALALLAGAGWITLDRDAGIFITVLAYGAGVNYSLFLIARYREERERGLDPARAVAGAIGSIGGAISASATTVIGGIAMLACARFGKIHQAGLTIPLALVVVLCAVLTFTGALLRLVGKCAFWPQSGGIPESEGGITGFLRRLPQRSLVSSFWEKLGQALLRRPGTIWLAGVAACLPFAIVALRHCHDHNFNSISELPADMPSVAGLRALKRHFPAGCLSPVSVMLENDRVDFTHQHGIDLIGRWTAALRKEQDDLGLVDIRSVAKPLGTTAAAKKALANIPVPAVLLEDAVRERAVRYYVSRVGEWKPHVTRVDLTLQAHPLSRQALDDLSRIKEALQTALPAELADSRLSICGPTASAHDLAAVKEADLWLVQALVPAVVFVLLVLMLRGVVTSAYLVASVLFCYVATLGATIVVFWSLDPAGFAGLEWEVPIFLFTILVAVGADYNIFLLARIGQEQRRHGSLKGITLALAETGPVITGCGLVLAGTYATLLCGSPAAMKQLGFALALGILLDTLLVRPLLLPAFLLVLQCTTSPDSWHFLSGNR
jgi:RND superfamily putative drug exporter